MNIDFKNIIIKNLPKNIILPRRSLIYVGFQCHLKCGFCYYKYKCNEPMFNFEKIKLQIDFEYEYGIRDFEITGGEPSEYIKLRNICEYIKLKDHTSKIAIITNGNLWKCDVWDLIDEVLISYHLGRNCIYDKMMFPLGCTYLNVKKTIDIARQFNILVRTNTVVATFNLDILNNIINDLIEFKPDIINFLPVNLFDLAKSLSNYINYELLREKIKNTIDILTRNLSSLIFIRYMPFCKMNNYEKYIVGLLLHIYDWFDWNRELDGVQILDMINNKLKYLSLLGNYGSTSISKALEIRKTFYLKTADCTKCKYFLICDGVEKHNDLLKYIKPVKGKIITNILEYSQNTYNYYTDIYKNV